MMQFGVYIQERSHFWGKANISRCEKFKIFMAMKIILTLEKSALKENTTSSIFRKAKVEDFEEECYSIPIIFTL